MKKENVEKHVLEDKTPFRKLKEKNSTQNEKE